MKVKQIIDKGYNKKAIELIVEKAWDLFIKHGTPFTDGVQIMFDSLDRPAYNKS